MPKSVFTRRIDSGHRALKKHLQVMGEIRAILPRAAGEDSGCHYCCGTQREKKVKDDVWHSLALKAYPE